MWRLSLERGVTHACDMWRLLWERGVHMHVTCGDCRGEPGHVETADLSLIIISYTVKSAVFHR